MSFKKWGIIGFGAIMLLSGCATRSTDFAVRDPGAGMATGAQKGKIYVTVDENSFSRSVDPNKKFFVCSPYKAECDEPASDKIYQFIESYGFNTTKNRDESSYKIHIIGMMSVNPKKIGVDKEAPVIFGNAAKALEDQQDNVVLSPWIDQETPKDNADKLKKELISKGITYQGLMYNNFEVYNSLYTQTGQLTQTLAGGSPVAGIIGTLAIPIANAIWRMKSASEVKEGFVAINIKVLGSGTEVNTFVASDTDQNAKDMVVAGLDTALNRIKGKIYSQK